MNKVLIVIDAQEDFTRGALRNKEAIQALPIIHNLVDYASKNNIKIIYTKDTHRDDYLNTQEGKNLPVPHCICNTVGWALCPEVEVDIAKVIHKQTFGYPHWNVIEDLFAADEIWVCGFCTDICVISNVLILKALYPETPIVVFENACAGVTPEKHDAAIEVMKSCQIKIERWEM